MVYRSNPLRVNSYNISYPYDIIDGIAQPVWRLIKGWMVGVRFLAEARDFLYSTASRPALVPILSPIQWVSVFLFPEGKGAES
jgi:hypothetical protein